MRSSVVLALTDALSLGVGCSEPEKQPEAQGAGSPAQDTDLARFQPVVGESVATAEEWLRAQRLPSPRDPQVTVTAVRAIRIDGEEQMLTKDLRTDRLNVVVEQGAITSLDGVY